MQVPIRLLEKFTGQTKRMRIKTRKVEKLYMGGKNLISTSDTVSGGRVLLALRYKLRF